jgi:hypothetical protein
MFFFFVDLLFSCMKPGDCDYPITLRFLYVCVCVCVFFFLKSICSYVLGWHLLSRVDKMT